MKKTRKNLFHEISTTHKTMITARRQTISNPATVHTPVRTGLLLQRKCACGNHARGSECAECAKKKGLLQRKAIGDFERTEVPPIVHEVLRSPGQPLDAATRGLMEPRFGHDFSRVRVHADARAADSTRVLGALAYSVGRDVVFGAGQYVPGTREGQKLIAHELAHVVQQSANPGLNAVIPIDSDPGLEREANTVASSVTGNDKMPLETSRSASIRLSSKPDETPTSQRPAPGQQVPAPVQSSMVQAEDVSRLLDELLNFWYFASRFGIENANLAGDDRAAAFFLIALGGNLVWAATSFLNPAAALAIRLMSVGGAIVGSGTYPMLVSQGLPVDQCRERAKDMLGAIYTKFANEKIDLTNQLLREFEKWGLMDRNYAEHAEMRRSFAWGFLFDSKIPYNDPRALEREAKGDVEAIWGKYRPCWHGFQVFKLGQEYALHCYYEALVASGVADRAKGVKRYTSKVPEEIVRKTRLSGSVKHYEFPGGGSVEKYPYEVSGQFGEYLIHVPK